MTSGVWMNLYGNISVVGTALCGRQYAPALGSAPMSRNCCSMSAAHGCSEGLGRGPVGGMLYQMPEKSGLPSGIRGVGPSISWARARISLPSMPGSSPIVPRLMPHKRLRSIRNVSFGAMATFSVLKDRYMQQAIGKLRSYEPAGRPITVYSPCKDTDAEYSTSVSVFVHVDRGIEPRHDNAVFVEQLAGDRAHGVLGNGRLTHRARK